jgi:hypothetical protein
VLQSPGPASPGNGSEEAGSPGELSPSALVQAHMVPVGDQVSKAATDGGVAGVLGLMKKHASDAEFQWWCCDALASLCAGNEDNRAAVYVQNGVLTILAAMRLFPWEENVQTKANWALANMAASYGEFLHGECGCMARHLLVFAASSCPTGPWFECAIVVHALAR